MEIVSDLKFKTSFAHFRFDCKIKRFNAYCIWITPLAVVTLVPCSYKSNWN